MVSVLPAGRNKQLTGGFLRPAGLLGLALMILIAALAPARAAASALKSVRYHGYTVRVPAAWPVFHLAPGSRTCVRFNRHAVYLGTPSPAQRCPGHAVGRTEAILISPAPGLTHGAFRPQAAYAPAPTATPQEREARLTDPGHGVTVTATWNRAPQIIRGALRVRTLTRAGGSSAAGAGGQPRFRTQALRQAHNAGTTYTGPGFDACSTPSQHTMTAWGSSPYRALGIYIGGANSACAQPNLTTTWMSTQWAAGWHMIPIYVGLQAPSNSCGCAPISSSQASSEGTAAAQDAVAQAQAVGIGSGNPIYDDMEGYSHTSANTAAVMDFLAAWTTQLHAEGYASGVYSSGQSGIADLVARYGTTYVEPDNIWVADWNGQATTSDPYLPAADWPSHQRLHQYRGAHNETYGGATLNIDSDYLDGATAFGGTVAPAAAPSLSVSPTSSGTVRLAASWPGQSGVTSWQTLGGQSSSALAPLDTTPLTGGTTAIAERNAFPYYAVQAVDASGQVIGTSATVSPQPYVALYGRSAFVPRAGVTGVPAGCFTGAPCALSVTVTAGRRLLAQSGAQRLNTTGGMVFFTLNSVGRRLLSQARGLRLPVRVTVHDVSGRSASAPMTLVPYTTVGSGPRLSASRASTLRFVSLRAFVWHSTLGGILAACSGPAPCLIGVKISAGRTTVATKAPAFLGANTAGYLNFRLTPQGRALLASATGNQLGVSVTLTDAGATARGRLSLTTFR
ncbi:MAG TPA: glycoside hydrolase domain-containing protein [Solirubrobacteraceae bacterium]